MMERWCSYNNPRISASVFLSSTNSFVTHPRCRRRTSSIVNSRLSTSVAIMAGEQAMILGLVCAEVRRTMVVTWRVKLEVGPEEEE